MVSFIYQPIDTQKSQEALEAKRKYSREYMRRRRAEKLAAEGKPVSSVRNYERDRCTEKEFAKNAKYDPKRDGPVQYESITAQLFGDPPIGRRAIDRIAQR